MSWPDGFKGQRLFIGASRDLHTPLEPGGAPVVLAEARFEARMAEDKTITAIMADPLPEGLAQIVGARAGGHLRNALREVMPSMIAEAHPLYLILDDLSGTALVSAFAWLQWFPNWAEELKQRKGEDEHARLLTQRVNVCWGLQEGNSGVQPGGPPGNIADADAGDVRNPDDEHGWHALSDHEGAGFRRARRIDVTRDEDVGVLRIDSAFQDSAPRLDGSRIAIHEYALRVTADLESFELLSIEPEARILPFSECPGVIANTQRLVGRNLADIRNEVLMQLRGPEGCTHLNDALRALADVPQLVRAL